MLILFIFLVIVLIILLLHQTDVKPIHSFKQIQPYLKTGDVLLFSCRKHQNITNRIEYFCRTKLLGSEYGHVGIVYRDAEGLWLYECTDIGHIGSDESYWYNNYGIPSGLRIVYLDTVLRLYDQDYSGYFAVMFGSKEIPNDLFDSHLDIYSKAHFEDKIELVRMAFVDIGISHMAAVDLLKNQRPFGSYQRLMCSEFVYSILHNCNVVADYPAKLFWPHLFTNGTFNRLTKYPYTKPIAFTYV